MHNCVARAVNQESSCVVDEVITPGLSTLQGGHETASYACLAVNGRGFACYLRVLLFFLLLSSYFPFVFVVFFSPFFLLFLVTFLSFPYFLFSLFRFSFVTSHSFPYCFFFLFSCLKVTFRSFSYCFFSLFFFS